MDEDWRNFFEQAKKAASGGKFGYAETSWEAALQEAEAFGDVDERLIQTLEGQSDTFYLQGKFRHAEKPAHQVMEKYRQLHGDNHLTVGVSAQYLATVYHMQQKYGQAEPLYKLALSIKSKLLGANHSEVSSLRESYCDLLHKTNRRAEAEKLMKAAQAAGVGAAPAPAPAGPATPGGLFRNRAVSLDSLSSAAPAPEPTKITVEAPQVTWDQLKDDAERHAAAGRISDALELYNQAINLAEKFPSQELLAWSLDRAGELLFQTEKYGQAEMVWWRSLQVKLSALGENHVAVAYTANKLASLHYLLGRYAEAESYTKKCREIYKVCSGAEHPNVAICMHNLASLYHVQGRYPEAEEQYLASLHIRRKVLGTDHPDTLSASKNYAALLKTLGRDAEANELSAKAGALITGSWKAIEFEQDQLLGSRPNDD
jgi:tetratricopeptide (TPR) repeat protein